jgi:eukaryotic-like serine/threonine-protein kinase
MAQDFAGARLKAYRRIEHIARGSVSDLFLAENADIGGVVVLKVTPAIRKDSGIDQSMERFLQEFEILREIQHPHIVKIYDLGVTDDHLYLAMEHFARGDLRKRMSEGLTARQSMTYARDLAYALEAIHEVGIFHRDLKPGNVMLRDDGSIALIDFGLAKHVALKMEVTDKGLIFGTPHYMSPEQGHGKPIDARSDLYALGVMLFEMLTGRKPFDAENHMAILVHHAKAPIPKLPERLAVLQPVIDTLMAKDPADRPADATAAARLIAEALAAMPPPSATATRPMPMLTSSHDIPAAPLSTPPTS